MADFRWLYAASSQACILLDAQFPGRVQCAGKHVLIGGGKPDMRRAAPAPSAVDRQKDVRRSAMNAACCSGVSIRLP